MLVVARGREEELCSLICVFVVALKRLVHSLQTVETLKSLSGTTNKNSIKKKKKKSNVVTMKMDWTVIAQMLKIHDRLIFKLFSRLLWRYKVHCVY